MANLSSAQRWWMSAWPHRFHVWWRVPRFLRACPTPFRGEALEAGAGRGWTSRRVLETFPQVELTAVDVDPAVVQTFERLRRRYGNRLHVEQADVMGLPYGRATFDFVLAINVMQHLTPEERPEALDELLRVLRPGGLLGLSESSFLSGSKDNLWSEIKRDLAEENCQVLWADASGGFDIWARKEYDAQAALTTAPE